jgi:hypothetical protein
MRDPASEHLRMPARRSSPCPSPRRGTHIPMSIRFLMYRFGRRTVSQYIRCRPEGGSSCRIYPRNLRKHPQKSSNFSIFQYLALWRACEIQVFSVPIYLAGDHARERHTPAGKEEVGASLPRLGPGPPPLGPRGCLLSACAGSPRGGGLACHAFSRERRRRLRHHAGSAKLTAGRCGRQSGRQHTGCDRHNRAKAG